MPITQDKPVSLRPVRLLWIMSERMKQLPSEEFQDLLRPCFQEDEIKLIIIGGILGALAGIGQIAFIFGQSFFKL